MSSREIAERCEKQHKNVKRDIETMCAGLEINALSFERIYKDSRNRDQTEYYLPKDLTLTLVAGYNVVLRKRIIDRWLELEQQDRPIQAVLPDFTNPAEAARAWALQYEQTQALQITNQKQQAEIQALEPDAAAHQRFIEAEGSILISHAAKHLGVPQTALFRWMSENGWIFRRGGTWVAYSDKLDRGLLVMKFEEIRLGSITRLKEQTRVTPAGLSVLTKSINVSDVFIR